MIHDGPFVQSKIDPDFPEKFVAWLIWPRRRENPISIAEIIASWDELDLAADLPTVRTVKGIVEGLRLVHHCAIGASRGKAHGYFWILTAEDREVAVRAYRDQILSMWRTLRGMDSPAALRELHGQLRLEVD